MKGNNLFSLLLLIVIAIGAYFIVQTIRQTQQAVNATFSPVNQANQALQTQVSNLLNPTPTIIPDPVTYINEVRALARLEPHVRTCVVLSYNEGMSHREIAEATEMPLGTVKTHIRNGAQRLQEILSAYENPQEVTTP